MVVAYPAYMQPEWFTWEAYLWAVQLWYAYAMQVCDTCYPVASFHQTVMPGDVHVHLVSQTLHQACSLHLC